jgi:methyl-accepting chemotaxis protein
MPKQASELSLLSLTEATAKDYYAFMNETDLKAIKELLDQQAEQLEGRLEKRMIHIFDEGFEQVVLPNIAELNSNIGSLSDKVDSLDEKVDDLDSRTGRIERKLDAVVEYQDRQGQEIKEITKFIRMPEGA